MTNRNGELPPDWHGAKCNSVLSSSGNLTCDNTSSTPIKCVCEKTANGWDDGAHCSSNIDCKNNNCGFVTNDSQKQCCKYGAYNNICLYQTCSSDSDCTDKNATCGTILGVKTGQCCPYGTHIDKTTKRRVCN
jgi:hypothetical protein